MHENNQTIEIPTSNNLSKIVNEMVKLNDFTNKFAPLIVDYAKIIKTFDKIDAKELYNNARNIRDISDGINVFIKSVGVVMVGLKKLNDGINLKDVEDLREKLLTGETGGNTIIMKNIESKGGSSLDLTKEITKAKISKPGLIDIVAQVATLSGTMQALQFANPIKFRLKFLQTLNLFTWQYKKLVEFSSEFDVKTIRTIKFATDGLQEVMMSLPSAVAAMASMFSSYGGLRKRIQIKSGIKALLGDKMDGTGGIVGSILSLGKQLNEKTLNQTSVESFYKTIKTLNDAIKSITTTLAFVALAGPLLKLGIFVLFGRGKGKEGSGVIGVMINGLDWIANRMKSIQKAEQSLVYVAITILMLAAAVTLMVLTGALIVMGWKQIIMVSAFMIVLVGVFILVGKFSKSIEKGGKELLYIAASVAILGLTATAIVLIGQFIEFNWKSSLSILLFMALLTGMFVVLAELSNIIEKGTKQLIYISIAIGILVSVTALLLLIGNLIQVNWEGLVAISIMMGVVLGITALLVLVANLIKHNIVGILLVYAGIVLISGIVYLIADISRNVDTDKLSKTADIIFNLFGKFILVFGVIALAAMAIGPAIGIATVVIGVVCLGVLLVANAIAKISSLNIQDTDVFADIIRMMVNGIKVFFEEDNWKYLNPISLAYVMTCMGQLMFITLSLGMMARVLRNIASLRIPTEWDSKGNPTKYEVLDTNSFISAGENAASILQFFTALFGDEPTVLSNGIVVGGAMNGLDKVTRSTRLKVKRLRKIVNYVGSMAKTLQDIASLRIPTEWDSKGNPTEFTRMGTRDLLTASLNAGGILMFFGSLFADTPTNLRVLGGEVRINPLSMDYLDNISRSTRRKIKRLKRIVGYVGDMAGILQKMAVLTVPNEIDPETGKVKSWRKMNSGDFENVSTNIATITTTIISAMANNEVSELLDSMSKHATKNFERVMSAISGISSVTNMIQMIAGGEIPTRFVTDPKDPNKRIPVKWVSFSKLLGDESIKTGIRSLFDVVIDACTYKGTNADDLENASNSIDNIKKVMEGSSSCIAVLVTSYKNNLSQLNEDEFTVRYDKITGTMSKLISIMGGRGVDVKKSREIQKNIKETTGLIKQIDNTNLDKLKYASDMMANISRLSASIKGNFEGLADVINEKLVKAIEELKEQLEKLNNTPKSETTTPSPISKDMSQSGTPGALRKVTEANKPELNKPTISVQDINEIKRNINEILGTIRGVIDVSGMCIKTKEQ